MKIGILTGGGDAPGLNGIIESCGRTLITMGHSFVGIQNGFQGVFERRVMPLGMSDLEDLHAKAGTVLGTSNKCGTGGREKEFIDCFKKLELDGLVVAGGDGTFQGLEKVKNELNFVGVPKTIDNDLSGTEVTFGYDTACSVVVEAVEALRSTARAHERIMVVETMGRTAGWIALGGGLASYSDVILLPERPFDREKLLSYVKEKRDLGKRALLIVVSEGAFAKGETPEVAFKVEGSPQEERFGGIAERLARWLEKETNWEARHVVLGHLQRSRNPSTTDRFLTLAMGVLAARLVNSKKWHQGVVYNDGRVSTVPIEQLMGETRTVPSDHRWVRLALSLGIFI